MRDPEQNLRTEIEEKIVQKLIGAPLYKHGRKYQGFNLPAILVEKWSKRPHIDIVDTLPFQNPAKLILTYQDDWEENVIKTIGFFRRKKIIKEIIDHPAFKSAQVHIRIQKLPDSISFVYQLGLTKNQEGLLTAYKNQPLGNSGDSPSMPINLTVREITLEDLTMFNKFLDEAQSLS